MALDDILTSVRRTAGDTIIASGVTAGASMLAENYLENSTGSDPLITLLEVGCGLAGGYLIKKAMLGNFSNKRSRKTKKNLLDRGIGTTAATVAGNVFALNEIVNYVSNQEPGYAQALIAAGLGAGMYVANKIVPPAVEFIGKLLPKKNLFEVLKRFGLAASLVYAGVSGAGYVNERESRGNISRDYNTKINYNNHKVKNLLETDKVDQNFLSSLEGMCNRLNMNCMAVLSVMHYETGGSFSPSIKNPGSSATGLIQFMGSTAKGLGTTTKKLSEMTQTEQLEYVEKYFNLIKDNFDEVNYMDPKNVALAVFYPSAIGKGDNHIIAEEGRSKLDDRILKANKDHNGDGKITAKEYTGKALSMGYLQ
ncbi:MAG: hypothetical protein Q8Q01_00135 [archaeon]|nr:hypothetical protein [archaeon]